MRVTALEIAIRIRVARSLLAEAHELARCEPTMENAALLIQACRDDLKTVSISLQEAPTNG